MTAKELLDRQCCGRASCKCYRAASAGHGLTHCPAHDDRTPSLNVQQEGETTVWRCHAGCTQEAVTAAIAELAERQAAAATAVRRVVAFYDYRDEAGELLYQVLRYRPKDFRQRKPDGDGSWSWSLNGVRRVLYHLPELVAAKPRRWVLLVEGEKDADRLFEAGILATCYAGGAKAPWVKEWTEQLRGRRVAIIPDADRPGLARARRDAKKLAGICAELKVVALPGLEVKQDHGEDVSDWLEQGHELTELKQLVDSAPAFDPAESPLQTEAPEPQPVVDDPVRESQLVVRRLAELASLPGADLNWVAERFVAIGAVTDLTAFIKVGKSTLSSQLIAAILHGEPFLGEFKTEKSSVVLLTEEPAVSLQGELVDAGVEEEDPLHLVLWAENNGPSWPEVTAEAAALCRQVEARLLVIDTLSWWAGVEDEGDSGEARTAMRWLLHVASSGTAVLVLRQGRKQGGEIHNAGRGSGAYGGAADILLHLDYVHDEKGRAMEESTRRLLRMKSRLEREQPLPMKLDYEHGLYHLLERPVRQVPLAERLHRLLLQRGKPATITELLAIMPTRKATMIAGLRTLMEARLVERQGAGTHLSPFLYTALPLPGTTAQIPFPGSVPEAGTDGNSTDAHAGARAQTPGDAAPTGQLVPTPPERIRNASPATVPAPGTATPEPAAPFLAAGGSENGAAQMEDRRRLPCPDCGALPYTAGPAGPPQRRCHSCDLVWTPEPLNTRRTAP